MTATPDPAPGVVLALDVGTSSVRCLAYDGALSSRLAEAGRLLSGSRHVRIYHDHALVKPGGERSRETNWHQDAPYWPMGNRSFVQEVRAEKSGTHSIVLTDGTRLRLSRGRRKLLADLL